MLALGSSAEDVGVCKVQNFERLAKILFCFVKEHPKLRWRLIKELVSWC